MQRAVCKGIANEIPEMSNFLKERMVRSPQLSVEKMENSDVKASKRCEANGFGYHAELFPIWANKSTVARSTFEEKDS